jgi:mgtE-like transporter
VQVAESSRRQRLRARVAEGPRRVLQRRPSRVSLRGLLGPDPTGARQSLIALMISSLTATIAGLLLAGFTGRLEELPGLLVLVPAAIGMRGNIFGALGSRLSTTIHAGTFRVSRRVDTTVGQNLVAAAILSLFTAVALGVATKALAPAFGLDPVIGLADLLVVSTVGAVLSSLVVLVLTLGLAATSARKGWDLDNVNAPLVSAAGDVVTLPALFLASELVGIDLVTPILAVLLAAAAVASTWWGLRSSLTQLHQILRESMPFLLGTGAVDIFAGVVIEHQLHDFARFRAVFILVPACLAGAGAIGGILSGRISSKMHLGLVEPSMAPSRSTRLDLWFGFVLAVPVFFTTGVLAHFGGTLLGFESPGIVRLMAISMMGGLMATVLAGALAYYGAVFALRLGFDPDTCGVPLVTSTVDLGGAAALVAAISWVGLP